MSTSTSSPLTSYLVVFIDITTPPRPAISPERSRPPPGPHGGPPRLSGDLGCPSALSSSAWTTDRDFVAPPLDGKLRRGRAAAFL